MKIFLKTEDEIELMRQANQLVGKTLGELAKHIKPGVTTLQLDQVADEFIRDHGAIPTFKGFPNPYGGPFPASICTSCVGEVSEEVKELLRVTKESLYKGIDNAVAGRHLGDISSAVQDHCEAHGYGIVRELTGHGIGREMHEDPQVPNYGRRGNGVMLKASMCIAIEPMITMGKRDIWLDDKDRWTIRTQDGKPAAHFEHTLVVRKGKAEILSSFEEVENIEGKLY